MKLETWTRTCIRKMTATRLQKVDYLYIFGNFEKRTVEASYPLMKR